MWTNNVRLVKCENEIDIWKWRYIIGIGQSDGVLQYFSFSNNVTNNEAH